MEILTMFDIGSRPTIMKSVVELADRIGRIGMLSSWPITLSSTLDSMQTD